MKVKGLPPARGQGGRNMFPGASVSRRPSAAWRCRVVNNRRVRPDPAGHRAHASHPRKLFQGAKLRTSGRRRSAASSRSRRGEYRRVLVDGSWIDGLPGRRANGSAYVDRTSTALFVSTRGSAASAARAACAGAQSFGVAPGDDHGQGPHQRRAADGRGCDWRAHHDTIAPRRRGDQSSRLHVPGHRPRRIGDARHHRNEDCSTRGAALSPYFLDGPWSPKGRPPSPISRLRHAGGDRVASRRRFRRARPSAAEEAFRHWPAPQDDG